MLLLSLLGGLAGLLLAGLLYQKVGTSRDLGRFPVLGALIEVDGHRLHLQVTGTTTTGPTVVFDGGAGGPSFIWSLVQPHVEKFARVVVYDRAGYAWSEDSDKPRTSQQAVNELYALLKKADIPGPYLLVGHSFGGLNMRLFAHQHPELVAGMVLVDATHEDEVTDLFPAEHWKGFQFGVKMIGIMARLAPFGLVRLMTKLGWMPGLDSYNKFPEDKRQLLLHFSTHTKLLKTIYREMSAMEESYEQVRQTGALGDIPLVVIGAEENQMMPGLKPEVAAKIKQAAHDVQRKLSQLSTRGTLLTATNSGHNVMIDKPEVVVEAIRMVVQEMQEEEVHRLARQ